MAPLAPAPTSEIHPNSGFTIDLSGDAFMDLTSGIQFPSGADASGGTLGANVFMSDNAHVASELRTGGPLWGGRLCRLDLGATVEDCLANPDQHSPGNESIIKTFWEPNPDDPNGSDFGDDARLIISDNAKRTFHFDVREQNRYGIERGIIQAGPGFKLMQDFDPNGGRFDIGIGGFTGETTLFVVPDTGDPADLNMDGFVDGLDLGILLGNWDQTTTPDMGELNGTPPVDGLDLGILLGAWNPPPLSAAVGTVPEPASAVLLGLCFCMFAAHRRHRAIDTTTVSSDD